MRPVPGREAWLRRDPMRMHAGIGIYTQFIEFANFRIPFSKFLLCVLQYYQINFSQLSVLAAAKISHFEIMCRVLVHQPSLGTFHMGLLDFVKSVDPFRVKTGERTLADGEVPLLTKTADMVVAPSDQVVRLVSHTIADEIKEHSGKNKRKVGFSNVTPPVKKARAGGVRINEPVATTVGKSPAVIQKLITQSDQAQVDSEAAASRAEEFVSSSVTPTPEHDYEDESISTHDDNVAPPVSSLHVDVDIAATGHVVETGDSFVPRAGVGEPSVLGNETGTSSTALDHGSPVDDFYNSHTVDSVIAHNIYVPKWDVTNDAQMDDPAMCRNLVDHLPPPACFFEVVQQRDAEIVVLKTMLEKAENDVVGVVKLRRRVSELEATTAAKAEELAGFSVQNAKLSGQVSGLESVRDGLKGKVVELESECECSRGQVEGEAKLKERFMAMQDAEVQRLVDRASALDARLSELSY
ncbi:hypothetical protein Tco_1311207 [Tanacetum coccineum]